MQIEAQHVTFCITILSFPTVISHIPTNGDLPQIYRQHVGYTLAVSHPHCVGVAHILCCPSTVSGFGPQQTAGPTAQMEIINEE